MFKIGDLVAHYKDGTCEVTNIGKLDMNYSDKSKDYYTLKPLYTQGGRLYTPVSNEKHQIRPVITKEEAEDLIRQIPEIELIVVPDEKRRETLYKEALLKNQCQDWISIIKTAYARKKKRLEAGKKSINVDEKYLGIAEKFLYGELAAALEIKKDEVKNLVLEQIEK